MMPSDPERTDDSNRAALCEFACGVMCAPPVLLQVETIGDAYMAVANLVRDQSNNHTLLITCFAIEAIRAANKTYILEEHPEFGCASLRAPSLNIVAHLVMAKRVRKAGDHVYQPFVRGTIPFGILFLHLIGKGPSGCSSWA